jgi:recombination protein RecA
MNETKQTAINIALKHIEDTFGKGAIMKFGEKPAADVQVIPTGALSVDVALGVGGLPRGRIVEIYGPESSGKTTLTLHIIAEAQKMGGTCAFIDAEHALDPVYARALGVDVDNLYISQPDDGEQALEICDQIVRSAGIDVVVVDSVAALTPKAELSGDMGEAHMALQARLMSQALRKLTAACGRFNVMIIFTNQLRTTFNMYGMAGETTTGGKALKFYASVRVDIRRVSGDAGTIKSGDKIIGNRAKIKVAKNKVAPPFKTCEVDIIFGEGISKVADLLDLGVDAEVLSKSGSWYSYGETRLGNGREAVKANLAAQPALLVEIEDKVRAHFGLPTLTEIRSRSLDVDVEIPASTKPAKKGKGKKQESRRAAPEGAEPENEGEAEAE